jgi:hypothetical protein
MVRSGGRSISTPKPRPSSSAEVSIA